MNESLYILPDLAIQHEHCSAARRIHQQQDLPEPSKHLAVPQGGELLAANIFAFDPLLRPHKPKRNGLFFHMWIITPFEREIL